LKIVSNQYGKFYKCFECPFGEYSLGYPENSKLVEECTKCSEFA